jgi:hypothetical protein
MEAEQLDMAYALCAECGYVYDTPYDLISAWVEASPYARNRDVPAWADEITFCPRCLHDF